MVTTQQGQQGAGRGLDFARDVAGRIRDRIKQDLIGRDDVIELVLVALFSDGHILLEDFPGSGKTTLAKALGNSIMDDLPDDEIPSFRRVQFTPDMLPSDVIGVMVLDTQTNRFYFRRGPIFAYVLLVDEINRATPKVQSALLEAMAEKQVTVDNESYPLNELFFTIATQNPMDAVGTYPLPKAQLDRFLFKVRMHYLDRRDEIEVVDAWGMPRQTRDLPKVLRGEVVEAREIIRHQVHVAPRIRVGLVDLARGIRQDPRVALGISTRSLVQAVPALQTLAALRGRDYVVPQDLEYLSVPLFQHRVVMLPGEDNPEDVVMQATRMVIEDLAEAMLK